VFIRVDQCPKIGLNEKEANRLTISGFLLWIAKTLFLIF
jgi:hypothetical protein